MKRLIAIANKEIGEYLTSKGVEHNGTFDCMGTNIDWKDIPDDIDFTGYEIVPTNVLYEGSLTVKYGTNRINIQLPMWMKQALFAAKTQGQSDCIGLLTKLKFENDLIHKGERIPYDNTIS